MTNKEASTVLCSVAKHLERVEHSRTVGKNIKSFYLFYDKEFTDFPTHWAEFSNQTLFSNEAFARVRICCFCYVFCPNLANLVIFVQFLYYSC